MNGNGENSAKLHDSKQALDVYIDKLLIDTSTEVEEIGSPINTDDKSTPVLVLGSAEDSEHDLPADSSSIQGKLEDARMIQEKIYESNPEPHQESAIRSMHPNQASAVLESNERGDKDNEKDSDADAELRHSHLKFKVAGLNLVIPYDCVHGDLPWYTEKFTEIDGPQWLFGEALIEGHCVKLVDIAPLVIPPSRHTALLSVSRPAFNHVLILSDMSWGIACDKIEGGIELQPVQVQWRIERGKRPWLAGTIVSEKSALLDIDAILHFLEYGRWDG